LDVQASASKEEKRAIDDYTGATDLLGMFA